MDIKIQVQVIVASILCFGLLMVALYILLIGPIREIFTDETVFTETYQKIINGNMYTNYQAVFIEKRTRTLF